MKLTAAQAATRAGVSRSLVYAWCRGRQLRHSRAGTLNRRGKIVIDEADLDAFLKTLEVPTGAAAPVGFRHIRH